MPPRSSFRLAATLLPLCLLVGIVALIVLVNRPGSDSGKADTDPPSDKVAADSAAVEAQRTKADNRARILRGLPPKDEQPIAARPTVVRATSLIPSGAKRAKFLTGPMAGDPLDIALDFVRDEDNTADFAADDYVTPKISDRYVSRHNGVTHLYLQQQHQGIDVYNGLMNANVMPDGSIINLHNGFVSQLADQVNRTEPLLTAQQAIESVANFYKVPLTERLQALPVEEPDQVARKQLFSEGGLSLDPIPARLVYLALENDSTRLAWNTVIRFDDGKRWLDVNVDAETGDVLSQANWIASASYNVYPRPIESPNHGGRSILTNPHNATASPFGWHDTNGAAGAEFTDTRGNNVNAQDDIDASDSGGSRPDGGAGLNFNNPLNLNNRPDTYLEAVTTNLFYWNNIIHDIFWHYGFDEASGNFQENNYGNGGAGSDPVEADSQDGSGTDNANFGTPPDGSNPRMQMFIFTYTDPNRDSAIDNGIIVHEYGHGISNRLTGGPANSSALFASQSRGMGEGWSDWLALALTATAGDTSTKARGMGTYVLGQPTSGSGIRPYRYTTDMNVNPQTFGDLASGTLTIPHGIGSVWCTTLWEIYWSLVDEYGFDSDIYNGTGGNNIAIQLVLDGMKLQPASPTYLDARDAIIMADQVNNGGANFVRLWAAFAKRGMGASADDGGDPNSMEVTEAFDLPDDLDVTPGSQEKFQPSGKPGGPFTPFSETYTLSNTGTSSLDWTAAVDVPWLDVSASSGTLAGGANTTVDISVNASANGLAVGSYQGTISFTNTTSTAVLQRSVVLASTNLTEALDEPAMTYSTDLPLWYLQTLVNHDGVDAARSGNVVDGETSWMETTVTGPDILNFFWKVDSESGRDFLRFLVDDVEQKAISGNVDWNRISFDVPAGDHLLRWEFVKDGANSVGADSGWVDEMALASLHPEPLITSDLTALVATGDPFSYQIEATASPTSYSSTSLPIGLLLNTSSGEITGTPTVTGNYPVDITATNGFGASTETLTIVVYDLSEALDEPGMSFTSSPPLWFGQSQVTHDGVDALQAGDVDDSESSYVETTVTGPDEISFFWKVDSEQNWDYLRFLDNGVQQEAISGDVDWQRIVYSIPSGSHVLRWEYDKDIIISAGADTGWLDEVILASLHPEPIIYSELEVNGLVNRAFAYQIEATMNPTSYATTGQLPPGVGFNTSTGRILGFATTAGTYPIEITATNAAGTGTENLVITIDDLSTTIDEPSIPIASAPPKNWFTQTEVTHDGISAAQAGDVDDNEVSWMQMTVDGPDTISFFWKVDSEANWDYLRFFDNGSQKYSITGNVDWHKITYDIPPGTRELRWEYDKDVIISVGADTGWVDEVFIDSLHPEPKISSALRVIGAIDDPFSYQIVATRNPTSYSSSNLPPGLGINTSTGEISGVPTVAGKYPVTITATNGAGSDTDDLLIVLMDTAEYPFMETFEGGSFQPFWQVTGTGAARTLVTSNHAPNNGTRHATMDTTVNTVDARNELTLALDLEGQSRVVLRFWAKDMGNELDGPPPLPFTEGADFDGVAISADGVNWFEVQPLRNEIEGSYSQFSVDLDDAIALYGLEYNSTFQIRFNYFDNFTMPNGGFAFDDISVGDFGPEIAIEDPLLTDLDDGISSYDLGSANTGASTDHVFTVLNVGTDPLTGLAASFTGANAGDFSAVLGATSLNPGETTTATVTFAPGALGGRGATLQIASNDADENPFDINLNGSGTDSDIVVEFPTGTGLTDGAGTIDFGTKAVASTTTHTVTIRNAGSTSLNNLSASVVGAGAAHFVISTPPPTSLAPGLSDTFQVSFSPLAAGVFSPDLQIASNDTDETPFDIALMAVGARPEIEVEIEGTEVSDGGEFFFDDLIGSSSGSQTVNGVIRNTGAVPLLGVTSSVDGPDASNFRAPGLINVTIEGGESRAFTLVFLPSGNGNRTAAIHIANNDEDEGPFDFIVNAARLEATTLGSYADGHSLVGDERLPGADDDDDSLTLLEEYAFNLDPTANDRAVMEPGGESGLPLIRVVNDRLQVEYLRRRGDPALTYRVEFSSDMSESPPDGFEDSTEPEAISYANDNYFRVIVRDSVSVTAEPRRFGRVKVELSE